jgi:hypothetical protein
MSFQALGAQLLSTQLKRVKGVAVFPQPWKLIAEC